MDLKELILKMSVWSDSPQTESTYDIFAVELNKVQPIDFVEKSCIVLYYLSFDKLMLDIKQYWKRISWDEWKMIAYNLSDQEFPVQTLLMFVNRFLQVDLIKAFATMDTKNPEIKKRVLGWYNRARPVFSFTSLDRKKLYPSWDYSDVQAILIKQGATPTVNVEPTILDPDKF